jgi:hypothetical protein
LLIKHLCNEAIPDFNRTILLFGFKSGGLERLPDAGGGFSFEVKLGA